MEKKNCVILKLDNKQYKLYSEDIKAVQVYEFKKTPKIPSFEKYTEDERKAIVEYIQKNGVPENIS